MQHINGQQIQYLGVYNFATVMSTLSTSTLDYDNFMSLENTSNLNVTKSQHHSCGPN